MDLQLTCVRAVNEGRLADAEAAAAEGAAWTPVLPHAAGGYGVQMFSIRREQGRLESVRAVVEAVAANGDEGPTWGPGLAALYAELGLTDRASALLDDLIADDLAAVPRDSLWAGSLSYLADAAVATGHGDAAAVLYRELLPYRGYQVLLSGLACYGAADRYLGRLAEQIGRLGDATGHLEAALRLDESMGSRTWVAHSQLALGQHLSGRGRPADRRRAGALLEAARAGATACGLVVVARRAGDALAELGDVDIDGNGAGSEPGGRGGPVLALTGRELTVLRLVADGRTNRQIGDALNLSQHTVANHLRSILLKTGCANRTEAATYAQRQGLLAR
jgi:DNA-binding CsgD family transcriptional regulator/tetratricopeptide (TPR) repeat protein